MKKWKIELAIVLLCLLVISLVPVVFGAPGDVTITLVIPAAKVADFQAGFLAKCPIPLIVNPDYDPNDPESPRRIEQYTPKQWITEWLKGKAMRAYRQGKTILAKRTAIVDPNVIL